MAGRTYDRGDLLRAWLRMREYRDAHEDLSSYFEARYRAFAGAFGVDLDVKPDPWTSPARFPRWLEDWLRENGPRYPWIRAGHWQPEHENRSLQRLFDDVVSTLESRRGGVWLETPPGIGAFHERFGERLVRAEQEALRTRLEELRELIECIWGLEPSVTVSDEDLRQQGFDPDALAPDPWHYL